MNTQNENKTIQDLKQDLIETKIDSLISMTRTSIILLMITLTLVLTIFLGSASFQSRTDKRTEAIIEKLDSNLSK
jgi:hypothetical protein